MTFATQHNGGRSEVNFNFLGGSGDYPFIDITKTSQNLVYAGAGPHQYEWVDPATLDSDGYPTSLPSGGCFTQCYGPSDPTLLASSWTMAWAGNGTVSPPAAVATGSATSTAGSGSLTFIPTSSTFSWGIMSTSASPNHVRNIRICPTARVSALAGGAVFNPEFLAGITDAKFGVLRFLNWQSANTTSITTWATRKPLTYFSYGAYEFRPAFYCGVTSGTGNNYTVSGNGTGIPSSGAPTDKMTIQLRFHANGTGASTLSLNGTTAKPIRDPNGGAGFAPVGLSGTVFIYATAIFDAELDSWIVYNEGSQGIDGCVPPELSIRLCAETGTHPWYTLPIMAHGTDFYPSLAAHIRDTYNGDDTKPCPWMIPRFEGPNEMFNQGYHFYQTNMAVTKSAVLWSGGNYHDYSGMMSSVLGQQIASVYGISQPNVKTQKKYQTIIGLQTYGGLNGSDEKFNSTRYISNGPTIGSYTRSAAKDWSTHACIATYYSPSEYQTPAEINRAVDYYRRNDPAIIDSWLESTLDGSGVFSLPAFITLLASWKTYIKSFGINNLCAYEGGYSPDYYNPEALVSVITKASKAVVTTTPLIGTVTTGPGALVGMYAFIYDANGMPGIDRTPIQIFAVNGNDYTLNIDSTSFGTYTSGAHIIFYVDAAATNSLYNITSAMKDAGKYRPKLAAINTAIYQAFVGLTDSTFTAEFPSHYLFSGGVGVGAAWDLQNDIFQTPKSAQYQSIQNFNSVKRASPPRMRIHS